MSVLQNAVCWNGWQFGPHQFRPLALEPISQVWPDLLGVSPDLARLARISGKGTNARTAPIEIVDSCSTLAQQGRYSSILASQNEAVLFHYGTTGAAAKPLLLAFGRYVPNSFKRSTRRGAL